MLSKLSLSDSVLGPRLRSKHRVLLLSPAIRSLSSDGRDAVPVTPEIGSWINNRLETQSECFLIFASKFILKLCFSET